jgi:hypothetical protein
MTKRFVALLALAALSLSAQDWTDWAEEVAREFAITSNSEELQ